MSTVVFKPNYLRIYAHKRHQIICKTYQLIAFKVFPEQGSGFNKLRCRNTGFVCARIMGLRQMDRACASIDPSFGQTGYGTELMD